MKALTTGAGGFIGQELALALLNDTSCSQIVLIDLTEPPVPDGAVEYATTLSSVSADRTITEAR
jgi:malate/lactate dehydrogenase